MAIVSGNRINFVYVTGSRLPSVVDDSTVYILAESREMYVGSTLISNKGAQYREVTQAEYDALPATKYSDGIIYFVVDYEVITDDSGIVVVITPNGSTTWFFNNYSYSNQVDRPVPAALRSYLPTCPTSDVYVTATSAYYHDTGNRDGWIGFVFNQYDYPVIRVWTDGWSYNAGMFDGEYIVGDGSGENPDTQIHEYHYQEGGDLPVESQYGKIILNGKTYGTSSGGGESFVHSDTTAGWASQATLVAQANNIYVYTDYQSASGQNIPGIKIGDGNAYLIDLPFIDTIYAQHIADSEIHVSSTDRTNWDNKVTCYIDPNDNAKLIFSN